jgi:hypothetical protein
MGVHGQRLPPQTQGVEMKRKKAKPEIVWMPWHKEYGLAYAYTNLTRNQVVSDMLGGFGLSWKEIRVYGWRIKRVKITEV